MTRIIALIFLAFIPLAGSNATTGSTPTSGNTVTCDLAKATEDEDIAAVRAMLEANCPVDALKPSDRMTPLTAAMNVGTEH